MVSKLTKIDGAELTSLGLETAEKVFDLLGASVHSLRVIAHYLPPVALVLEGIASIAELNEDRENEKLSLVDRGAQIVITSLVMGASVVGFLSFAVAALSPAMPLVYAAGAGLLALSAVHRIYLIKKDPEYQELRAQKNNLLNEFNALMKEAPELKDELKQLVSEGNAEAFDSKAKAIMEKKLPEKVRKGLTSYLAHYKAFSDKREAYKEYRQELRQIKAKVVLHSAFFIAGAVIGGILLAGAAANPVGAAIALGSVAVGYFAYRVGLISKIRSFFLKQEVKRNQVESQLRSEKTLQEGLSGQDEEKLEGQPEVARLSDNERQVYNHHQAKGHKNALELVSDFKELGKEQQEVYQKLMQGSALSHDKMMMRAQKLGDINKQYHDLTASHLEELHQLQPKAFVTYQQVRSDHGLSHENALLLTKLTDQQLKKFKTHFEQENGSRDFTASYEHATMGLT